MNNFDRYLHRRLSAQAARVHVPAGDLRGVVKRGRRRQRRRRASLSLATVVSVIAVIGVVVALHLDSSPTHRVIIGDGPSTPLAVSAHLTWKVATPGAGNGLGYLSDLDNGTTDAGTTLYALSSAPGQVQPYPGPSPNFEGRNTLYQSSDGVNWATAAGPQGLSLSHLAADGDQIYAVGTGTAVASVPSMGKDLYTVGVAAHSASGSWTTTMLPLDFAAIGQVATTNGTETATVAAGPKGVVALVSLNAILDLSKLSAIPGSQQNDPAWTVTAQGVTLLDQACPSTSTPVVTQSTAPDVMCYDQGGTGGGAVPQDRVGASEASYTWAQLGIGGDVLRAVLGEPFLFSSTDGTTFSPVDLPSTPVEAANLQVVAGTSGFALTFLSLNHDDATVWTSTDGNQWSATPPLTGGPANINTVGYVNGQLTLVGTNVSLDVPGPATVATLSPAGWNSQPIPGNLGGNLSSAIGPLGIAVVTEASPASPTTTIGTTPSTSSGDSAAGGYEVLFSPDGTTWSAEDLATLSGGAVGPIDATSVNGGQVLVTFQRPGSTAEVTVIGTPG